MTDFIYDIETYPNIFTAIFKQVNTENFWIFEISYWKNDMDELLNFLMALKAGNHRMVGFNNVGFDYPVIHFIIENHKHVNVHDIYKKAMSIINTPWNNRFADVIWGNNQHVKQVDLYKIHHFDNAAKSTSLKVLEFNMRSDNIEDLPYPPGSWLYRKQCDHLIEYNKHDVTETEKFYHHSQDMIRFREELGVKYEHDFLNHNDTKIGKDYIIMELEKLMPGSCYDRSSGKRKPRQTPREDIPVKDILFPYIQFEHKEFNRVLEWFRGHTIVNTKGDLDLSCTINNFEFIFGSGGIHGSVSSQIVQSDDINTIIDIDVASYYPNLAIENRLYPEHLGERYCDVYKDVYEQRKSYRKGTAENAMLKLALNGTYGDSNNKYSPFYDPKYTMSITINGQLLLCMLAEQLMKTASVEMIQINTDGLTIKCPRTIVPWVKEIMSWWEDVTKLELEMAEYNRMMIRDVNNYIAEYTDNKLKRKGAYEHERGWHQQHSSLVVQKAAEAKLVHGVDVRDFIEDHKDIMDFMLNTKVPRSSKLVYVDYEDKDHLLQNVTRYYISNLGGSLIKIMPPTKTMIKAGNTADRRIGINTSWKVTPCNDIKDCRPEEIEFDYYIQEANKLVEPLLEG